MQNPSPNDLPTHSQHKVRKVLFRELPKARNSKLGIYAATSEKARLQSWQLMLGSRDSSQNDSSLDYGS